MKGQLIMKKIFICIIALFATILLIISPEKSVGYALDSLGICYEVIIPSLFPFSYAPRFWFTQAFATVFPKVCALL